MTRKKILIVEDEFRIALEIAGRIESMGFGVAGLAATGKEALELADRTRPDLALVSVALAGDIDGLQAAEIIHKNYHVPIVFLASPSDGKAIEEAGKTYPHGYLLEPFDDITLHAAAEVAFHRIDPKALPVESEGLYRLLAESPGDMVMYMNLEDLRLTYISPAVKKILGYTVEEALGLNLTSRLTPGSLELVKQTLEQGLTDELDGASESAEPRQLELEIYHKDGSRKWINVAVTFARNPDNRPVGVIGAARDVTDRRLAELALEESEKKYRYLVEHTAEGICVVRDGYVKFVNQAMLEIFGYGRDAMLSMPFHYLVHPEDLKTMGPWDWSSMSLQTEPREYVCRLVDRYAGVLRARMRLVGVEWERKPAVMIVLTDITELLQVTEDLRKSQERYRNILAGIEEGYYEVDLAGNFTFFNLALREMLGYSAEELFGMNNRQYMSEDQASETYREFNQVFRTGVPARAVDWTLFGKDGRSRLVEASISLLHNDNGEPIGFRGIVRDVTAHRQAEEERALREKMQGAVELAGAACHELNQPLQAVCGYTEVILAGMAKDHPHRELLEKVLEQSREMARITRRLNNITRYVTTDYLEGGDKILDMERSTDY